MAGPSRRKQRGGCNCRAESRRRVPGVFGRGAARKGRTGRVFGECGKGVGAVARRSSPTACWSAASVATGASKSCSSLDPWLAGLDVEMHYVDWQCAMVCPPYGKRRTDARRGNRRRDIVEVLEGLGVRNHCGEVDDAGMRASPEGLQRGGKSGRLPSHCCAFQHSCCSRRTHSKVTTAQRLWRYDANPGSAASSYGGRRKRLTQTQTASDIPEGRSRRAVLRQWGASRKWRCEQSSARPHQQKVAVWAEQRSATPAWKYTSEEKRTVASER